MLAWLLFHTYNSQLLLVACGTLQWIQWTIVPHLSLPLSMEVIGHHIDKIQVLGNLRNIITA